MQKPRKWDLIWAQHGLQTDHPFVFSKFHGPLRLNLNSTSVTRIQPPPPASHLSSQHPHSPSCVISMSSHHSQLPTLSSKYLLNSSTEWICLCFRRLVCFLFPTWTLYIMLWSQWVRVPTQADAFSTCSFKSSLNDFPPHSSKILLF